MKESMQELYDIMKRMRDECEWNKDYNFDNYEHKIKDEAAEVLEALKNKDFKNLKEEIGDLLAASVFLAIMCEEAGHFDLKESIQDVIAKLKRRQPWIFGDEKVSTKEEAQAIWDRVKKEEKENE